MELMIEKSINGIEKRILPIYDNDADHEALVTAIDTMRKYQKINALYLEYKAQNIGFDTFALETMKVLKDDNNKT